MVPLSCVRVKVCERAWMRGLSAASAPRSCPAEVSSARAQRAFIADRAAQLHRINEGRGGEGAGSPAPTEARPLFKVALTVGSGSVMHVT